MNLVNEANAPYILFGAYLTLALAAVLKDLAKFLA